MLRQYTKHCKICVVHGGVAPAHGRVDTDVLYVPRDVAAADELDFDHHCRGSNNFFRRKMLGHDRVIVLAGQRHEESEKQQTILLCNRQSKFPALHPFCPDIALEYTQKTSVRFPIPSTHGHETFHVVVLRELRSRSELRKNREEALLVVIELQRTNDNIGSSRTQRLWELRKIKLLEGTHLSVCFGVWEGAWGRQLGTASLRFTVMQSNFCNGRIKKSNE